MGENKRYAVDSSKEREETWDNDLNSKEKRGEKKREREKNQLSTLGNGFE